MSHSVGHPVTVFWPIDLRRPGYCFGWASQNFCVAGTLDASCLADARKTLASRIASLQLHASRDSVPIVLGLCSIEANGEYPSPVIDALSGQNYIVIYYYRHSSRSLRFYSLHGLRLDFGPHTQTKPHYPFLTADFTSDDKSLCRTDLALTLDQFNVAKMLSDALQKDSEPQPPLWVQLASRFSSGFSFLSKAASILSSSTTSICNTRIFLIPSMPVVKDVSATVQQLDVRAEQSEFFDHQTRTLMSGQKSSVPIYVARYVNFFNAVWLVLNDVTIGFAFGSFLCENHNYLAKLLQLAIELILVGWTQWALGWLNSWPAGLKLNTELSQFYVDTFVNLISFWGELLQAMMPYFSAIIYGIGVVSFGGMTMGLSMFSDLLSILTVHVYVCYLLSTSVYYRSLRTIASLWNLFRGKRYNVLRKRVDSWEYDTDQLLFGTMFFTLLTFLFPTIIAYYLLFAMLRLLVILLHAAIEIQISFMNHFPLFALMLRLKDPWRLPGGIYLSFETSAHTLQPVVIIKNQPLSLSAIFYQFIPLWKRLASHYNPLRLVGYLVRGQHLASIPRYSIRYSKIPDAQAVET